MSRWTLNDISEKLRDIDFAMLLTRSGSDEITGRPMSNNRDVEYDGDTYFFTLQGADMVAHIEREPKVALSYAGNKGLLGKPPMFIAMQGVAELIRDKDQFAMHWTNDLESWFENGIDTPGLVLIKVHATRIHYWNGDEEGEVRVSADQAATPVRQRA
jgi:general stress protein 26